MVIVRDYSKTGYSLKLAWKFIISTLIPNDELLIYIDANTGNVISKRSLLLDVNTQGTAATKYSGNQGITCDSYSGGYRLRENRNGVNVQTMNMQGGSNITNAIDFNNSNTNWTFGSWPNITSDQQALDAHWAEEKVLDYWHTIFSRNSLDGNGLQILGYVHYYQPNNPNWPNNAMWDGLAHIILYGDGDGIVFRPLTALDVVAHEMGHGINEFTADLGSSIGTQESDALNEGFSDIWGACVEHWSAPEKQTWLMGEDILMPPYTCLRDLQNPKDTLAEEGEHPDTYHGQYWDYGGEPHNNSTVLSHWFYLLSVGKNDTNDFRDAYWVNGIGIDEAQQIAFRGEKNLFSSATYADARNAMINAAINLYGTSSCELVNVTNAWYAVGVGSPFHYSNAFITGPQTASTTNTTFTFSNCSHVSSISWTHSNDLVYESGQGTNNYTVQALSCSESEMGWVQAIVNSGYGNDTLKKNVWVGVPATPTIICPYTIVGLNSLIEVNAVGPGAESYNWSVAGGTITSGQGTSDIWIQTASGIPVCPVDLTIRLTTSNACGNSAQAVKSIPFDCSGGGGGVTPLSVSPNPADNILTIEINNNNTSDNLNNTNSKTSELRVYDKMMNLKMKKTFRGRKTQINVRNLKQGVYILQIISGNKIFKKEIMVSHH